MQQISYYVNCTAVGDTVCTVPVVKALIKDWRLHKVIGKPRVCEIMRICGVNKNFIHEIETAEDIKNFDPQGSSVVGANCPGHAAYRIHLIDLFSVFPVNAMLKPEEKEISIRAELLPPLPFTPEKDYIVVGCGYAMESRKMPLEVYNKVIGYAWSQGLDVVLLGAKRQGLPSRQINFEEYPDTGCINLIDKTTVSESVRIMNDVRCKAVVGVDSGLIYLASMTKTPIICGYTFVDPYYRMPFRRGAKFFAIEPRGDCRYCSNRLAMFGVEFDSACPFGKDFSCAKTLHHVDYLKALKRIIHPSKTTS